MASAAGVAGVRATLDLGSKSFKSVQCREPDSARIARDSEVIHLDEKRPTLSCDLRRVVSSQSAVCRQPVKLAYFRVADDPLTGSKAHGHCRSPRIETI